MSFLLGFPIFRGYVELRGGYINNKSGAQRYDPCNEKVDPQKKWPSFLDNYPGKYQQSSNDWLVVSNIFYFHPYLGKMNPI